MTESNLQLVQRLFDQYAEGGVEAVLGGLHEDVVIEIPADLSAEPDTYRGHDGARRYFAGFEGMLEDVRYEPIELIPEREYVLAHVRLGGRGVSSGLDVELESVVLHEFSDGLVTRMRPYPDLASARDAIR
jgi:ketosteroid isomerase-like protein